jgi:hypothetical protein
MNRRVQGFLIAGIFLLSTIRLQAQTTTVNLNSAYQMRIGDYAALILPELLKVHPQLDAPVVATFEPDPGTIDVEIFGGRGNVEGAKETVQGYLQFLVSTHMPYVAKKFGLKLTDQDYRILYYDRTNRGGPKLILKYIKGQFTLPAQ